MKRITLIIIAFLFFQFAVGQTKAIVIDELSRQPVQYAKVIQSGNGVYSDSHGKFDLSTFSQAQPIIISHINYTSKEIAPREILDTIVLSKRPIELDQLIIPSKKVDSIRIKPPLTATNYSSWVLFPKDELLSLIKLNAGEPKSLRSLSVKFESSNERERSNDTIKNSLIRINIYEAANDSIQKHIYSGVPIKINGIDNDILTINLAGENIELGQNGLFVGIEMLGYVDTHGNLIYENSYARPGLSRKTSKVISVKSYLRSIFDGKNDMKLISDILKSSPNIDDLEVRNLSVGLTLK